MQQSIIITLLLSLTSLASAASSRSVDITDLSISVGGNNSISFALFDNEPDARSPTSVGKCSASFADGHAQGLSIPCVGDRYTASISSYNSYDDFSLHITYTYHDSTVGQPDSVTVFANAAITSADLTCTPAARRHAKDLSARQSASHTCSQPSGTLIAAPITSMIA